MIDSEVPLIVSRSGILARRFPISITTKRMAINQDIKALVFDKKLLTLDYFFAQLQSNEVFILKYIVKTGTTVQSINMPDFNKLMLATPNLDEQSKVGHFFKVIDKTIELHQRILNNQKQLYRQYLTMLIPVNDFTNAKIKSSNSQENWNTYKIKELFTITRGNVLSKNEVSSERSSLYPYPVYSSQTRYNGLMGYYSQYLFENAITWTTDGANAGTVNYRKEKFYSTNVNGVLLSKEIPTNKFIAESLNRIAWKHVSRVGNPKLMNNVMGDIKIILPSKKEQIILSKLLESFNEQISLYQKKLDILQKIKIVYLRKMFL